MDTIEVKYQMGYICGKRKPVLTSGGGLPVNLEEALPEYEAIVKAIDVFIQKVDSLPDREVLVEGGLELHIR